MKSQNKSKAPHKLEQVLLNTIKLSFKNSMDSKKISKSLLYKTFQLQNLKRIILNIKDIKEVHKYYCSTTRMQRITEFLFSL